MRESEEFSGFSQPLGILGADEAKIFYSTARRPMRYLSRFGNGRGEEGEDCEV
jgi:hypothetical protein